MHARVRASTTTTVQHEQGTGLSYHTVSGRGWKRVTGLVFFPDLSSFVLDPIYKDMLEDCFPSSAALSSPLWTAMIGLGGGGGGESQGSAGAAREQLPHRRLVLYNSPLLTVLLLPFFSLYATHHPFLKSEVLGLNRFGPSLMFPMFVEGAWPVERWRDANLPDRPVNDTEQQQQHHHGLRRSKPTFGCFTAGNSKDAGWRTEQVLQGVYEIV